MKSVCFVLILSLLIPITVNADISQQENQEEIIIQEDIKITEDNIIDYEELIDLETTEIISEETTEEITAISNTAEPIAEAETIIEIISKISTESYPYEEYIEISTENAEENNEEIKQSFKEEQTVYNAANYYKSDNSISLASEEPDHKLNGAGGKVEIGDPIRNDDNTFCCSVKLPAGSTYVTISVTDGKFVLPLEENILENNYGLEFSYGVDTETDTLIKSHTSENIYGILTFKVNDVEAADSALSQIKYTTTYKNAELKISTTTATLDENSYIFYGHIYQIKTQENSSWSEAVVDAHNTVITADDGAVESGYLATITSVNENKMLLKMIEKNGSYTKAWIGGTCNYQIETTTSWWGKEQNTVTDKLMDYDYINTKVSNNTSESTYFTDDTMIKSASAGHNALSGEDFYWIDGPEKGETLPDGGSFWCDSNHNKWGSNEPNDGHVVWVGYGGPYWDDMKLNQENADNPINYIVEFGGKIDPSGGESTPISDAEAYAKIKIEEITVEFNDNKASPNTTTEALFKGESVKLPKTERTGYNFLGWSIFQNSSNYVGDDNNIYTPDNDITLYAQWEPLIQFESVTDSGIYDTDEQSKANAENGVISFNFRVIGSNELIEVILNDFTDFYIRINDVLDIRSDNNTKPTYYSSVIDDDKPGYWMHCIIENIPENNYSSYISALPYAITNDGETITGDSVSANVDNSNRVRKDWQH